MGDMVEEKRLEGTEEGSENMRDRKIIKIQNHRHCLRCGVKIAFNKHFCSKDCKADDTQDIRCERMRLRRGFYERQKELKS